MRRAVIFLAAMPLAACEDAGAEKEKACSYAVEDAERRLAANDVQAARAEHAKAVAVCPPKLEERVTNLGKSIDGVETRLKTLREEQDRAEREKAAKAASKNFGELPVIGAHSAETGATGDCKTYVDCLCGLADSYRYKVGVDAHRAVCNDAKKVLAGKNAQEGCRTLLKELAEQDDRWKEPYELQGVSVPTMCP